MVDDPESGLWQSFRGMPRRIVSFISGLILDVLRCLCSSFLLLNASIGLCLIVPTAGAVICERAIISANDPFFGGAFGVSATGVVGDAEFG